ncbi:MAG: glycosyltransferase family 39 protein [Acidobacteria bacterium]|nr:glycosyltransferase family 39 protein [Acidobacteriota bacterium]
MNELTLREANELSSRPAAKLGSAKILLIVAAVAFLLFNVGTLLLYPPVESDEGFYSSHAYNFSKQGTVGLPGMGEWYGASDNYVATGRLYLVGLALAFRLLGVSVFSARAFSLLGGAVAVYWTYRLGKHLYGRRAGVGAAIILASSQQMFFSSHYARMDVWLAAMVAFAAYLLVYSQSTQSGTLTFVAGLVAALMVDIHWNGLYLLVGFCLAWIIHNKGQGRFLRLVCAYSLGMAMGMVYWILGHFLPDPATAWRQLTVGWAEVGFIPWTAGLLQNVTNQLHMWKQEYFGIQFTGIIGSRAGLGTVELLYTVFALGYSVSRRNRNHWFLLVAGLGATVSFALLSVPKVVFYRIAWVPLVAVLISSAIMEFGKKLSHRFRSVSALLLAFLLGAPLVVAYLSADLYLIHKFKGYSYASEIERVQGTVLPNSVVLGPMKWWYGFQERTYLSTDFPRVVFSNTTINDSQPTNDVAERRRLAEFVSALRTRNVQTLTVIDWAGPSRNNLPSHQRGYLKLFEAGWCQVQDTFDSYSSQSPRPISVYRCMSNDNWSSHRAVERDPEALVRARPPHE